MELHVYFAFVVATAIMIALPGPSVLLTVAHSISFGWRYSLFTVAGATVGIAIQLLIASFSLHSLLQAVAEVFGWLRWGGAIYLVYLGIKQWRGADEPIEFDVSSISKKNLLVQGVVITVPNPKSLVFIAAFLPQFIDMTKPLTMQFVYIIPTFLLITFAVTSLWALAAGNMRDVLMKKHIMKPVFKTAGGLMVVAGVGLAMARRGNG